MARCWTRRGRAGRPLVLAKSPPGAETLAPEALHCSHGIGLQAIKRSPGHAGLAEPRFPRLLSVLGFAGRLVSPGPFGFREAADPRIFLCILPIYDGDAACTTAAHRTLEAVSFRVKAPVTRRAG